MEIEFAQSVVKKALPKNSGNGKEWRDFFEAGEAIGAIEKKSLALAGKMQSAKNKTDALLIGLHALGDMLDEVEADLYSEQEVDQIRTLGWTYVSVLESLFADQVRFPRGQKNLANIVRAELQQNCSEMLVRNETSRFGSDEKLHERCFRHVELLFRGALGNDKGRTEFDGFQRGVVGCAATAVLFLRTEGKDGQPKFSVKLPSPEEDASFTTDLILIDEEKLRSVEESKQRAIASAINRAIESGNGEKSFLSFLSGEEKKYIRLVQIKCSKNEGTDIETTKQFSERRMSTGEGGLFEGKDREKRDFFEWAARNGVDSSIFIVVQETDAKTILRRDRH